MSTEQRRSRLRSFSESECDPAVGHGSLIDLGLANTGPDIRSGSLNAIHLDASGTVPEFNETPLGHGLGTSLCPTVSTESASVGGLRQEVDDFIMTVTKWE